MLPKRLQKKITERRENNSLRSLGTENNLIDFSSNDYLGFSKNSAIYNRTLEILEAHHLKRNGATGSRLLSGNHRLYNHTESLLANYHNSEAALIYNSGYDANLGFFSSVAQRGDIILYDELCHASIRDGIRMSNATAIKIKHNDIADLKRKYQSDYKSKGSENEIYVVTESVFSMDGDQADLLSLSQFCSENAIHLIIDEAHAIGVIGQKGVGLVQELKIEEAVFARMITFGKALGCHGAAVLGSADLKQYLLNFSRSFIYTTGLPPHSVATILASYESLESTKEIEKLHDNIALFRSEINQNRIENHFIESTSAIQSCIIPGNQQVKSLSEILKKEGFDIKPILSPTVPEGKERLRVCIHSYTTEGEIKKLVSLLKEHI